MKIAILTQPLHNNYGGNLQNYALQKVLRGMGHEPTTIDRHDSIKLGAKIRVIFKLAYFKRLVLYYLKGTPKPLWKNYYISKKEQAYIRQDITAFIDVHIKKTPRLYSNSAVKKIFKKNNFDAVIVGSDQVWRPTYSPNIYTYYLDFLSGNRKIKKIAYAASFGTDEWEYNQEQTKRCRELIQQFDLITVREKEAVKLVSEKFNKNADFVLDPTMLLSKEDYEQLFKDKNLLDKKGVYTYILDNSDWKDQVVEAVKKKLNLPQFSNQQSKNELEMSRIPSIEGWIKGFSDADFIVTDSFHGTIFSIIFNKPFISLVNFNRGASRFESILNEFGLIDRLIGGVDKVKIENALSNNYSPDIINNKLLLLKENSINKIIEQIK